MASLSEDVYFSLIKYSAAPIKSSNTFCFFSNIPALCHVSPYSPPPLILAKTNTHPCSKNAIRAALKLGFMDALNPP